MVIERAIRASVRELQKSPDPSNQEALNRAIQASIAEANRRRAQQAGQPIEMTDEEIEHQELLAQAVSIRANCQPLLLIGAFLTLKPQIQESLSGYQITPVTSQLADVDTDDDEDVKLAIAKSKEQHSINEAVHVNTDSEDDEDIKRAIEMSKQQHTTVPTAHGDDDDLMSVIEKSKTDKTEEEIVLEYVKKQSLLEEEHRKALLEKGKEIEGHSKGEKESAADADALRQAIEESMRGGSEAGPSGT